MVKKQVEIQEVLFELAVAMTEPEGKLHIKIKIQTVRKSLQIKDCWKL